MCCYRKKLNIFSFFPYIHSSIKMQLSSKTKCLLCIMSFIFVGRGEKDLTERGVCRKRNKEVNLFQIYTMNRKIFIIIYDRYIIPYTYNI